LAGRFDVIGPWSEVKLDILRDYASPYSRIVAANGFYHLYIDAYAAGGEHISRTTNEIVPGSPLIALSTEPPFREYHFIDADPTRVEQLRRKTANRSDVHVHSGDCNEILLRVVFPGASYESRRRALCLLDPYNIDLKWEVIAAVGRMRSIEVFVNFMVMDMNMNVLLRNPAKADPVQVARMDRYWGDRSWQQAIVAGFAYAPNPLRFVNSLGFTIYYLFFASPNQTGKKIVEAIFEKHRIRQGI